MRRTSIAHYVRNRNRLSNRLIREFHSPAESVISPFEKVDVASSHISIAQPALVIWRAGMHVAKVVVCLH